MDYRNRKYYLVNWSYDRNYRIKNLKLLAPSIKMHSPYNHFKSFENGNKMAYDGLAKNCTGILGVDTMLSCKKEESEAVEYELRKMARRDSDFVWGRGKFCEITKEMCGQ